MTTTRATARRPPLSKTRLRPHIKTMSLSDEDHMAQALQLARRGLGQTWPNPSVGAIVVAPTGEVLARGWTAPGGRPHAEAIALERAGANATWRDPLRYARALRAPWGQGRGLRRDHRRGKAGAGRHCASRSGPAHVRPRHRTSCRLRHRSERRRAERGSEGRRPRSYPSRHRGASRRDAKARRRRRRIDPARPRRAGLGHRSRCARPWPSPPGAARRDPRRPRHRSSPTTRP